MYPIVKFVAGACLVMAFALQSPVRESQASRVAFVGVRVIPGDSDQLLEDQTVVIEGDRITQVGPVNDIRIPPGAVSIAAQGKYLMPGIAEMHGHIPPPTDPHVERVLLLYVANGVTTVRGMLGFPNQLALRERVNRGELDGPALYLAGPSFSGSSINSTEQAEQRARQQKAEGWDLLKVHPGLTREEFDALARTAREIQMPFAGHVPAEVGLLHALSSGLQTIDHLDGYIEHLGEDQTAVSDEALRDLAIRTREAGAWVVPTMVLWETLLGVHELETMNRYDGLKYMPRQQVESWAAAHRQRSAAADFDRAQSRRVAENRKRLLRAMNEEDVKILFGTDSPQQFSVPGYSIYREFKAMTDSGMTPAEVIRTATANVGSYFSGKDKFGLIQPGMRADLILLDANPLADLQNIRNRSGVMVRGRWLPETEIQKRLETFAQ
jgi:imidazolonepropionase-like amidohydrolase